MRPGSKDQHWMKIALREAQKAYQLNEVPIGAVIVKEAQLIARAHNLKETNNDPTSHAEILAIQAACDFLESWRLKGCSLYVTVEPCPMCAGAIVQSRIDYVVFGAKDPKAWGNLSIEQIVSNSQLNHRAEIYSGLCEDESKRIMRKFFEELRS